jgi:hypothetical protein
MMNRTSITERIAALQAEQQKITTDANTRLEQLEAEKHATIERANLAIGERLGRIAILRELLEATDTTDAGTNAERGEETTIDGTGETSVGIESPADATA